MEWRTQACNPTSLTQREQFFLVWFAALEQVRTRWFQEPLGTGRCWDSFTSCSAPPRSAASHWSVGTFSVRAQQTSASLQHLQYQEASWSPTPWVGKLRHKRLKSCRVWQLCRLCYPCPMCCCLDLFWDNMMGYQLPTSVRRKQDRCWGVKDELKAVS